MQRSEGSSESASTVALRTSTSAQAPVVQPVPASQQVQQVQHVYQSQVQYVEGAEAVYPNGTIRTAYSYNPESQLYGQGSGSNYFDSQAGGTQVTTVVSSAGGVPAHSMVGIAMDVGGSQIISSGSAYLIHGGMEGGRHHTSHSSRSSSAMVQCTVLKSLNTVPLVTWGSYSVTLRS
ncbi:transcription factor RFX3 [Pimephales promelas]|nr:transcription factor RFX3 [Pimephales promelas]KAG1973627.1 transcription factor RFX3 [Pimephales promelas]